MDSSLSTKSRAYYARLGHLGGIALRERRGKGYLRHIAGHGGRTTKARKTPQEPGYYARIGRLGAQARHRNWLAKKAEAAL